ncbi:hypothetical protein [Lysobacter sp. HA18]
MDPINSAEPHEGVVVDARGPTTTGVVLAILVIVVVLGGGGYWLIRAGSQLDAASLPLAHAPTNKATRELPSVPVQVDAVAPVAPLSAAPRMTADAPSVMQPVVVPAVDDIATKRKPSPVVAPVAHDLIAIASETPPAAGQQGLVDAMRAGRLRLASDADIQQWIARSSRPVSVDRMHFMGRSGTYVVTGDFVMPSGLTGAHSAVFLLPQGVPFPKGDPGHSIILDMSSGACAGVTCAMLRD